VPVPYEGDVPVTYEDDVPVPHEGDVPEPHITAAVNVVICYYF
jgi:hypothetical protein